MGGRKREREYALPFVGLLPKYLVQDKARKLNSIKVSHLDDEAQVLGASSVAFQDDREQQDRRRARRPTLLRDMGLPRVVFTSCSKCLFFLFFQEETWRAEVPLSC